ncbi:MAG: hypothetical protein ACO3YO_07820 [Chthoniobacterales bacterium]|jgi:hypothetical protein
MKYILALVVHLAATVMLPAGEAADHRHSHADIVVPATLSELRAGIAAQQSALSAALGAKDATAAHAATDALAAFVKAVPAAAEGLEATAKERVVGMANNAARAWSETAHAAEHGDYDKAGREAAKAAAAYRLLESRLQPR